MTPAQLDVLVREENKTQERAARQQGQPQRSVRRITKPGESAIERSMNRM